MHAAHGHDGRNRMLENQLLLVIGFEHQRVLIETLDPARELDAAQEIDRHHSLFFARIVKKTILNILRWFIHLAESWPEKL